MCGSKGCLDYGNITDVMGTWASLMALRDSWAVKRELALTGKRYNIAIVVLTICNLTLLSMSLTLQKSNKNTPRERIHCVM